MVRRGASGRLILIGLGAVAAVVIAAVVVTSGLFVPDVIDPPVLEQTEGVEPLVLVEIDRVTAELRADPREAVRWTRLGMAYQANVLNELAARCYVQSLALDDDDARTWYHLARARFEGGDLEAAIEAVEHALALDETVAHLHWQRGFWLLDLARTDDAALAFDRAAALSPGHPAPRVGQARVALQRGAPTEAAATLQDVLDRQTEGANASYVAGLLATAYQNSGRAADAARVRPREATRRARWADPWVAEMNRHRVLKAWVLHDAGQAIQAGRAADAVTPLVRLRNAGDRDPEVMLALGRALYVLGRLDAAIVQLEDALMVAPEHFGAHLNLALAYGQAGRLDLAVEHSATAVRLSPDDAVARLHDGRLRLESGDGAGALTSLQAALELGAADPMTHVWLAEALGMQGRWSEALDRLEEVVRHAPALAAAHVRLARARAEIGRIQEARASLEIARRLDPDDPDLAAVRQAIDRASSERRR